MPQYHLAGQEFQFSCSVLEMQEFETPLVESVLIREAFVPPSSLGNEYPLPSPLVLICQTVGFVAGANRRVETWSAPPGYLLKATSGSDFYIASDGGSIQRIENDEPWPKLDREILVGPVLVLALALRGVWSLHASAVTCNGHVIAFLGESGQGKSTLASHLSPRMQLTADDILPVTLTDSGLIGWPHFPQLKLPLDAQPGPSLPESLPVNHICLLDTAEEISLRPLSPSEAAQTLLRHTAGTRLFPPELLSKHLAFCAQAGSKIQVSRLTYPRRMDALQDVQKLLETLC